MDALRPSFAGVTPLMSSIQTTNVRFKHIEVILRPQQGASMNESPTTKSERLDMTQHRRTRALRQGVIAIPAAGALILAGCSGSGGDSRRLRRRGSGRVLVHVRHLEQPREPVRDARERLHGGEPRRHHHDEPDAERQVRRDDPHAAPGRQRRRTSSRRPPARGDARGLIPLAEAGFLEPLGDTAAEPRARGQRVDLRDRRRGLRPADGLHDRGGRREHGHRRA